MARQIERSPLDHQTEAAKQLVLSGGSGILADDMGLGKTGTSVVWAELFTSRTLVTAPKEVLSNIKEEIARWTNRPIFDLRNLPKSKRDFTIEVLRDFEKFFLLINLEGWSRDSELLTGLIGLQFQGIIIDEAHNVNNTRTLAFKGVREIAFAPNKCPECSALVTPKYKCNRSDCESGGKLNRFRYCLSCGHRQALVSIPDCECGCRLQSRLGEAQSVLGVLPMTGTPLLNSPKNLFPLANLTAPNDFPSPSKFRDDYITELGGGKAVFKPGAEERFLKKMGSRYIARSREDAGIVLPPQTVEVLEYDKNTTRYRGQWEAYRDLENSFAIRLATEVIPITEVVVQLTRLRQMITWPAGIVFRDEDGRITGQVNIEQSQKLDICEEKINEYLDCGQRIVAFSHFKAPLRELKKRLGNCAVVYDGDTPDDVRKEIRADFATHRASPRWRVVLCNFRSTGESLTLIGATQAVMIDEEWSPGRNNQAYRRIDRIGQSQETRVHIPRITGTVDTWLAEINKFKEKMSADFNQMSNYQSEMLKAIRGEI